jgi:hypothetical protein
MGDISILYWSWLFSAHVSVPYIRAGLESTFSFLILFLLSYLSEIVFQYVIYCIYEYSLSDAYSFYL